MDSALSNLVTQTCHSSSFAALPGYNQFFHERARNSAGFAHWKRKRIVQQAKLPVGIRHLRGVNARIGLLGEAPRGDSTPSKTLPGLFLF